MLNNDSIYKFFEKDVIEGVSNIFVRPIIINKLSEIYNCSSEFLYACYFEGEWCTPYEENLTDENKIGVFQQKMIDVIEYCFDDNDVAKMEDYFNIDVAYECWCNLLDWCIAEKDIDTLINHSISIGQLNDKIIYTLTEYGKFNTKEKEDENEIEME